MAKKGINTKLPPFVPMLWSMLNHRAYISLPWTAKGMLPYFLGKVKLPSNHKDPVYYKTTFEFTYSEGVRLGCARRTFFKVITDLMRFGFIDPVKKGGPRGYGLSSSVFILSDRWKLFGTSQFQTIFWNEFGQQQIKKQIMHKGTK